MDLFNRKKIKQLEKRIELYQEQTDSLCWHLTLQIESRLRRVEVHTNLVPKAAGIGIWKEDELPNN